MSRGPRFSLRLLGAVSIVIVGALIAIGLISEHLASNEVHRVLTEADARRADATAQRLARPLSRFFRKHAGWDAVEPLLAALAAAEGDCRILLLDPDDRVVATSHPDLAEIRSERLSNGLLRLWTDGGGPEQTRRFKLELLIMGGHEIADGGSAAEEPRGASAAEEPRGAGAVVVLPAADGLAGRRDPQSSLRARVLLSVAAAGLLALIATWLLSRRLLAPIDELIVAARHIQNGNLDYRVTPGAKGEIGQLAAAFNSMAGGLARLEGLRRQMVSDVAHELRTPLTGIRCQIETLQDGLIEPTAEVLASLHDDVMALQRLVEELQELAVAEAGGLRLECVAVAVKPAVEAALRALSIAGEVTLSIGELPPVLADPARLRQILSNLLDNALRQTPASGKVEVFAEQVGNQVRISVQDSGPGIEPEHLAQVFERFYRVDASRQRGTGGSGLGLAIVKQLVEAHGGRIWAESQPGSGACFSFTLPGSAGSY